jgi:hypothetical protein
MCFLKNYHQLNIYSTWQKNELRTDTTQFKWRTVLINDGGNYVHLETKGVNLEEIIKRFKIEKLF